MTVTRHSAGRVRRGGWCPYCNLELQALARALPRNRSVGAGVLAISPEPPDVTTSTVGGRGLGFAVSSDGANRLAREIGDPELIAACRADLAAR